MTEGKKIKKTKERSISYPMFSLESAVGRLISLDQNLGKGPYSREDAAKGMGYGGLNGASARAVSALVQYGLLDRNGNTYSLSLLSNNIIHPTSESEKAEAIRMAAVNPKLFSVLADRYKGQSLPGLLENIVLREGIGAAYAKEVTIVFKETLQFAGILVNGVVSLQNNETNTSVDSPLDVPSTSVFEQPVEKDTKDVMKVQENIFSDKGEGWMFTFRSVKPITRVLKMALIDAIGNWEDGVEPKETK